MINKAQRISNWRGENHVNFCAVCGCHPGQDNLIQDKNPSSGANRGRLCTDCITLLRLSKESPRILANMIVYLEDFDIRLEID